MPIEASSTASSSTTNALVYLRVLWRRKWLVLLVAIIGCGLAFAWTSRQPRIYEADCTLEYDPNPPKPLGREVEDVASPIAWWETRDYFLTQNKIIASRTLAEKVVRKLSLHENADFWGVPDENKSSWQRASVTDTAQLLQGMITVSQERDTRLVHIRVHDRSPDRATLLANTVAHAYIEKTMEDRLGATSNALDWLGKQLDGLKSQLEQSELSLHEFSEEHTNLAVSLEAQQNIVANNISQISTRLTDTKARRLELEARVNELRAANSDDPFSVYVSGTFEDSALAQLRSLRQGLLRTRETLAVQYGEAHPKLVSVDKQLESVRNALRSEISGMISAAQADVNEIAEVERGLQRALTEANKTGLELNLQEISHRRLLRERDNTAKLYGTLLERTAQTDLTRALQVAYVRTLDDALTPSDAVSPRVNVNLAVGSLLGAMFGVILALVLDQLDRRIRSVDDAEALGITILGIMPKIEESASNAHAYSRRRHEPNATEQMTNRDLVVHTHPKSSVSECFRTIRTNLTFMSAEKQRKTIVVTSANVREGKTTVALSLAISFAQGGKRVLIVDTDLRKPRLHRALGKPLGKGVTTVLVGEVAVKDAVQETEIPGLYFLASGPIPPNPAELLHTGQFRQLLADLAKSYDQVVLDSPPLAAVTDAAVIAPQVDGAILVIHSQRTTRDVLRTALRQLRDVGCQPTGGVLNEVDLSSMKYGYGSYYYYYNNEGYYETESNDEGSGRPTSSSAQA